MPSDLCTCVIAGSQVEMELDLSRGHGYYHCRRCGATEEGVRAAMYWVQVDWEQGGDGHPNAARIAHLELRELKARKEAWNRLNC